MRILESLCLSRELLSLVYPEGRTRMEWYSQGPHKASPHSLLIDCVVWYEAMGACLHAPNFNLLIVRMYPSLTRTLTKG